MDFIVSIGDPNDARNSANKKRVRSVAALKSWPERRRKNIEQLAQSVSGQTAFLLHDSDPAGRRKDDTTNGQNKPTDRPTTTTTKTNGQNQPTNQPTTTTTTTTATTATRPTFLNTGGRGSSGSSSHPDGEARQPRQQGLPLVGSSPPPPLRQSLPSRSSRSSRPSRPARPARPARPSRPARPARSSRPPPRASFSNCFHTEQRLIDASIQHTRARLSPAAVADAHVYAFQALHVATPCQCPQCIHRRLLAYLPSTTSDLLSAGLLPAGPCSRTKWMADGAEKTALGPVVDLADITPPPSPDYATRGRADPFHCCPVPFQPWFDHILHHLLTVYAPRGWPALKISDDEGIEWEWFMTQLALSEPALFYVRLLFGSGDLIRLRVLRSDIQYWLRAQAIKAINEALVDPRRSCSEAMILAIGRIALHEHMYGDKFASSHVHRPAQKRMIELRGGLKALDLPDLVKRLMRWSDRVMAVGSGTPRMLPDYDNGVAQPTVTLRQSLRAIEAWAPQEMPAVRSKINISDLVHDDVDDD